MNIKKEQTKKKPDFKMSLGLKRVLLSILLVLAAKGIVVTEEIMNAKVVEYFERDGYAFVGIDKTDDEETDLFLIIRRIKSFIELERLANRINRVGVVSVDDRDKTYPTSIGADTVWMHALLEVGGKSVLEILNRPQDFTLEAERQKRLQNGGR
jgi:hypothetical protein